MCLSVIVFEIPHATVGNLKPSFSSVTMILVITAVHVHVMLQRSQSSELLQSRDKVSKAALCRRRRIKELAGVVGRWMWIVDCREGR